MDEKQETKAGGKKSKTATTIIVIIALVVVFVVAGIYAGRYLTKKNITQTASPKPSSSATPEEGRGGGGGLVSPGSSPSGEDLGATWPSDLPAGLPQYSGGTVDSSGKTVNPGSWSIHITGSSQTEFDAYKNLLISQGWTIANPNDFRTNSYRLLKSGSGWDLTILYNSSGVLITLMEDV